jgi:hypothetical protein
VQWCENAFVNVLCKKYFNGTYTAINLGLAGCGNRGSIKELHFYPDLDWNNIDEIIVIYVPSGLERFDFINDTYDNHYRWKCMWPHYENMPESANRILSEGYAKLLSSIKFEVLEQLAHAQELLTWCKLKNARLIVTPGFDHRYDREYFQHCLWEVIHRDEKGSIVSVGDPNFNQYHTNIDNSNLIKLFPWDNMFMPAGYKTFADLVMSNENLTDTSDHFFQFFGLLK